MVGALRRDSDDGLNSVPLARRQRRALLESVARVLLAVQPFDFGPEPGLDTVVLADDGGLDGVVRSRPCVRPAFFGQLPLDTAELLLERLVGFGRRLGRGWCVVGVRSGPAELELRDDLVPGALALQGAGRSAARGRSS